MMLRYFSGGIDCHTHLELEYMGGVTKDNFYTGTRAALAGGVTMISRLSLPIFIIQGLGSTTHVLKS